MVQHDDAEFLLCTLQQGNLYQQPLDLNFVEGESLTLYTTGKGEPNVSSWPLIVYKPRIGAHRVDSLEIERTWALSELEE